MLKNFIVLLINKNNLLRVSAIINMIILIIYK